MKKQNLSKFSTLVKRSFVRTALSAFLLTGIASAAGAQQDGEGPQPSVKYIGSLEGKPLFKVDVDNKEGKTVYFTIKDDEGTVFYSEKIRGKQYSKFYQFDAAGRSDVKLSFVLAADKETQSQEFKINSSTRVLNDLEVTAL